MGDGERDDWGEWPESRLYSRKWEDFQLPPELIPPGERAPSIGDFITLSLKLISRDVDCTFGHWQKVPENDQEGLNDDEAQEDMLLMARHLREMGVGIKMVSDHLITAMTPEVRIRMVIEIAEEMHGTEFEAHKVLDESGNVIGVGLKPKDPSTGIEEITQWLHDH